MNPVNVKIRFLKTWGHPTRNLIMGVGDVAIVSQWIADNLVSSGYAEMVNENGHRETRPQEGR